MMIKRGFTLAEVLITLGVIGIVAAMILPSVLVQNRERENTAKLKKIYSTMTQAYTRVVAEQGTPEFWDLVGTDDPTGAKNIKDLLAPYFNTVPAADDETWKNLNTKLLSNRATGPNIGSGIGGKYSAFATVDGVSVAFTVEDKDCSAEFGDSDALKNVCATLIVDVNGKTNPNQFGFDIFQFYITKYGLQPYGSQADTTYPFEDSCQLGSDGYGCAAWVVFRGNMDYRHCTGLAWNGKSKCHGLDDSKYNSGL